MNSGHKETRTSKLRTSSSLTETQLNSKRASYCNANRKGYLPLASRGSDLADEYQR